MIRGRAVSDSPIFIVGHPRSGTGLVRDLLRSHPKVSIPSESHFIVRCYRAFGDPRSDPEARAIARRLLALRRVRAWGVALEPPEFNGCRSFPEIVDRIYGEVVRREGKHRWGDKTPQYLTEIPTLLRMFPGAKIVHVYRDGRDVALSTLRQPFGPSNLYTAAMSWRRDVGIARSDGRRAKGSYAEIRYEDLLTDPRQTMRELCEFLQEPFTDAVLRPDHGARYMWELRLYPHAIDSITAESEILSENHGKWRWSMDREKRALFESAAADRLAELDYEVEGLARRIGSGERIRWRIDDAASRALRTLRSPKRWAWTFLDPRLAVLRSHLQHALAAAGRLAAGRLRSGRVGRKGHDPLT